MTALDIPAARPYTVTLGGGILDDLGRELSQKHPPCAVVIVSGPRVWPLYGERVSASLEKSGFTVSHFIHPDGEEAKSLAVYGELLSFLCEKQLRRNDLLLSLGGGVSGDLCGFAAATYQRGMDYVQAPTTLLAMVDASVGGKTALNLPGGKNLVGAFHSPLAVYADPDTLATLPESQLRSGLGELLKTALLGDEALFSRLEQGVSPLGADVIARCIAIKRDIVAADEFDRGQRQLLNLGHSFGHAIELCSGFTLPHGLAVAEGMALIARGAARQGLFPPEALLRLLTLMAKLGLPTETAYGREEILGAAAADKKRRGGDITLVLPTAIGKCILRSVPFAELGAYLH